VQPVSRTTRLAGNVLRVPSVLTVIVYLLVTFGRWIDKRRFLRRVEGNAFLAFVVDPTERFPHRIWRRFAPKSGVSEVEQALLHALRQRVAGWQDPLAARGDVAQQG
jgi:hypothetical protein